MAWTCKICTFRNEHGGQKCGACDAEPINDALLELGVIQSLSDWTCSRCTYKNTHNGHKCEMCLNDQPQWDTVADMLQLQLHLVAETASSAEPVNEDSTQSGGAGNSLRGHPTNSFLQGQRSVTEGDISQLGADSVSGIQASFSNDGSTNSPEAERRIVLLGRTGSGKSATGNTILDDNTFVSNISPSSVTKGCQRGTCTRFGYFLQVIDTPGMYDTEMSIHDITTEVIKCVGMVAPGPHAFLLVLTPDRHTEEVQNTIDHFSKIFGEGMRDYVIIVFTKRDDLNHHGTTEKEFLEKAPGGLKDLIESCNHRCVTFNNRGTPGEKEEDVKRLLGVIDKMVQDNRGVYTSKMFQQAEKIMKEKEETLRREHDENVERQRRQIEERCKRELRNKEESYEAIICQLLQVLENREQSSQCDTDIQSQFEELEARHSEEIRRVKEQTEAEIEAVRNQNVNHREVARNEVSNGGALQFVLHTLVPAMMDLAKVIVPAVLQFCKKN